MKKFLEKRAKDRKKGEREPSYVLVSDGWTGTLGQIISESLRKCRFRDVGKVRRIAYEAGTIFNKIGEYRCQLLSVGEQHLTVSARNYSDGSESRLRLYLQDEPELGEESHFPVRTLPGINEG